MTLNVVWYMPDRLVGVFQKLLLYWDFPTNNHHQDLQRIIQRRENIQWVTALWEKNALLVPEVQGDWPDCFNLIIRWLIKSTCYNQGLQNAQHAKPWSRCATAPEDHTRCHSCKLRTQHWGYNLQQKTREDWRNLPTQISLSCAAIFGWCGEDFKQY